MFCGSGIPARIGRLQEAMTMNCPICGAAKLVRDTRGVPYLYKGDVAIISQVTGDFCPACDESILDAAGSSRTMSSMLAFSKRVNCFVALDPTSRFR